MATGTMTQPRFAPRRYTREPKAFGKARDIQWVDPEPGTEDQHAAARMQHDWAVLINRAAEQRYGSVKQYAEANDLRYDRLSRILRGTEIMRLEDIATAQRLLGVGGPNED